MVPRRHAIVAVGVVDGPVHAAPTCVHRRDVAQRPRPTIGLRRRVPARGPARSPADPGREGACCKRRCGRRVSTRNRPSVPWPPAPRCALRASGTSGVVPAPSDLRDVDDVAVPTTYVWSTRDSALGTGCRRSDAISRPSRIPVRRPRRRVPLDPRDPARPNCRNRSSLRSARTSAPPPDERSRFVAVEATAACTHRRGVTGDRFEGPAP